MMDLIKLAIHPFSSKANTGGLRFCPLLFSRQIFHEVHLSIFCPIKNYAMCTLCKSFLFYFKICPISLLQLFLSLYNWDDNFVCKQLKIFKVNI